MEITLREFRRHDFNTLWRIDQECFATGVAYSRQELSDYIQRRGSFTLVAEATPGATAQYSTEDPAPTGIIGFLVAEAGRRGTGHIITIDVLPIARRSGIGSQMLSTAEEKLRASTCFAVQLETAVDNAGALAFYQRHGYQNVGTIPQYYGNGQDAFSLAKQL